MNSFPSQVRAVAIALIFRRAVRLAGPVALSTSNGETVNLIASDAQKYYDLFPQINLIWTAPIQVIRLYEDKSSISHTQSLTRRIYNNNT